MLVVLFGLAGAGKTYVGKLLSEQSNFYFWDADEALTDEMKECIREKHSFTQEMRDRYFIIITERMKKLCVENTHVVIAQAFYKNKNRAQILSEFPNSLFIQVNVDIKTLFQRLHERNNAVDVDYANKISANFEAPTHKYYIINNDIENNVSSLIAQFMLIPALACVLTKNINLVRDSSIKEHAISGGMKLHRFFSGERSNHTEVFLESDIKKFRSKSENLTQITDKNMAALTNISLAHVLSKHAASLRKQPNVPITNRQI